MFQHDHQRPAARRTDQALRLALAGAVLAMMFAVFLPGPGYARPDAAPAVDTASAPGAWTAWSAEIRDGIRELWTTVTSPVTRLFGADTTTTTTTTDGTSGSGGFNPGGGGAWSDPDGAF